MEPELLKTIREVMKEELKPVRDDIRNLKLDV